MLLCWRRTCIHNTVKDSRIVINSREQNIIIIIILQDCVFFAVSPHIIPHIHTQTHTHLSVFILISTGNLGHVVCVTILLILIQPRSGKKINKVNCTKKELHSTHKTKITSFYLNRTSEQAAAVTVVVVVVAVAK